MAFGFRASMVTGLMIGVLALAGSADVALAGSVSSAGAGDARLEQLLRDPALKVELSLDQHRYAATESVLADVVVTNTSKAPVRLLSWYLPGGELEEDLFRVDVEDQPVGFLGAHFKRQAPAAQDYIWLAPGESLVRTVDLSRYYDLTDTGEYRIQFEAEAIQLRGIEEGLGKLVSSNEVRVWVEGREVAPVWQDEISRVERVDGLGYSKCSSTQQPTVKQAFDAANTYSDEATAYLKGTPSATARYTTWFGNYNLNGWNTALDHFGKIQDAFDTKSVVIDCSCKKVGVYAYVYANQPYKIYVCGAFWNAPLTGTDSKGGTLVHEMSHFTVVAGTDDWAYGQTDAKALAKSDPAKALDNADNHEYFAENNPKQN